MAIQFTVPAKACPTNYGVGFPEAYARIEEVSIDMKEKEFVVVLLAFANSEAAQIAKVEHDEIDVLVATMTEKKQKGEPTEDVEARIEELNYVVPVQSFEFRIPIPDGLNLHDRDAVFTYVYTQAKQRIEQEEIKDV